MKKSTPPPEYPFKIIKITIESEPHYVKYFELFYHLIDKKLVNLYVIKDIYDEEGNFIESQILL